MNKFYRFSSFFLSIGLVHTALTPLFYKSFSLNALWFAGTGIAFVFLGIINFIASRILQKWILNISIIANITMLAYSILITILLKEPQAYISILIVATVTVLSILMRYKMKYQ